jgi:hypothetical protein
MANQDNQNPLKKYFRQPKIYMRLPSKGIYYPPGALAMPESGELPVFAMTAKDEMIMKTPDALINGESTVEVIRSCVPNITDPWRMPSIDSDAVLIAIRLATFGEMLDITTNVPGLKEERTFQADLRTMLDQLSSFNFEPLIRVSDDITVEMRPVTYKEFTANSLKTFEEQRVFRIVNDDTISEDQKLAAFSSSFRKLTDITLDLVVSSIVCIDTVEGKVTDKKFIREFFANADRDMFEKILKHLEVMKDNSRIKPLKVVSSEEDIAAGAAAEYEIPITFDQSNFFA